MPTQQIPNKLISLNSQEIKLLRELIEEEKEACLTSLVSIGRWTPRLVRHFHTLLDLEEKVEGGEHDV